MAALKAGHDVVELPPAKLRDAFDQDCRGRRRLQHLNELFRLSLQFTNCFGQSLIPDLAGPLHDCAYRDIERSVGGVPLTHLPDLIAIPSRQEADLIRWDGDPLVTPGHFFEKLHKRQHTLIVTGDIESGVRN